MEDALGHVLQPGQAREWLSSLILKKNVLLMPSLKLKSNKYTLFTYQTNQTVRIKYKVMLRCLRITYQGMHTPYLQRGNHRDDSIFNNKLLSPSMTGKDRMTENVNKEQKGVPEKWTE